ncbi:hypothetical protein [Zunongwangia sp.]|uniref:hypothetical protein n=1 Tax=Zunongwangia sp. TaxID=1965325 RepID=UPI003AA8F1FF
MKHKLLIIAILCMAFGCKKRTDNTTESPKNSKVTPAESNDTTQDKINPYDNVDNLTSVTKDSLSTNTPNSITGNYKKVETEDSSCNCYCIKINLTENSEFCLKEDEIYINIRFKKAKGENNYSAFYVSPSSKNKNSKLPWRKFSTTNPIASINATKNGLKLDWLGFTINDEIAIDYAIYGKKTLEGNFIKID